jgi:hypothetical protein
MPSFKLNENTIKVKNAIPKGRRDNEIVLPELAISKKSIEAPKNKNMHAFISIRTPATWR